MARRRRIWRVDTAAGLAACALLTAILLAPFAPAASAAELLMFEEQGCPWCRKWHAEVGVAYHKSPEGRRAPLRRVDLAAPSQAGVTLAAPVTYSPTFVLVEKGREIGRITGYPGPDFFWSLLAELLAKLEKGTSRPPDGRVAVAGLGLAQCQSGGAM